MFAQPAFIFSCRTSKQVSREKDGGCVGGGEEKWGGGEVKGSKRKAVTFCREQAGSHHSQKNKSQQKEKKSIINLLLQPHGAAEGDGPLSDTLCLLQADHVRVLFPC